VRALRAGRRPGGPRCGSARRQVPGTLERYGAARLVRSAGPVRRGVGGRLTGSPPTAIRAVGVSRPRRLRRGSAAPSPVPLRHPDPGLPPGTFGDVGARRRASAGRSASRTTAPHAPPHDVRGGAAPHPPLLTLMFHRDVPVVQACAGPAFLDSDGRGMTWALPGPTRTKDENTVSRDNSSRAVVMAGADSRTGPWWRSHSPPTTTPWRPSGAPV